jgi:putative tricarboxylic transport membrane protein
MLSGLIAGFGEALSPFNLAYIIAGLLIGFAVGVLPGLNRSTAVALAIPLTFYLPPVTGISFLIGIAKGGATGGATTAILINTPGEPSSAATCLDGYPLARQGKAEKALKIALLGSVFGDIIATAVLIAVAQPLAAMAVKIGPFELAAVLIFALTFVAGLSGRSMLRGLAAGALGLFLSTVGTDIEAGTPRLTFGMFELADGVSLLAAGIGLLGVAEMLIQLENPEGSAGRIASVATTNPDDRRVTAADLRATAPDMLRASGIGVVVGIVPGLGGSVASFMSYAAAQRASATPERFGHGAIEGVAAAETADNAVVPASLVPLFALGIPGSTVAAMLIGAFTIHGIQPGPSMFQQHAGVIGGIYASMVVAAVLLLIIGWLLLKPFAQLARVPDRWVVPVVLCLCLTGAYLDDGGSVTAMFIMLGFGALGWLMRKLDYSVVALLVGFILGAPLERALRQSLALADGDPAVLLDHPIAIGFLLLAAGSAWYLGRAHARLKRLTIADAG